MSSFGLVNFGKNTGLKNDKVDEEKPLKYYDTSRWLNEPSPESAINFTQGFGISQNFIDTESRISRGNITNPRVRQDLGGLPVIAGGLYNTGPIISAMNMRENKGCEEFDGRYYDRHFYTLKENPNHAQAGPGFRQGVDTRMDIKEIYKK